MVKRPGVSVCFPPIADIAPFAQVRAMPFPRVFFDSNAGTLEHGYPLHFAQSRSDLEALGEELRDGTVVTIYMDDLEMDATLRFERAQDVWVAVPIEGTIRDLNAGS